MDTQRVENECRQIEADEKTAECTYGAENCGRHFSDEDGIKKDRELYLEKIEETQTRIIENVIDCTKLDRRIRDEVAKLQSLNDHELVVMTKLREATARSRATKDTPPFCPHYDPVYESNQDAKLLQF